MRRLVILVLLLAGFFGWWVFLRPKLPAAERGRRLAERTGCFGCHGPEGQKGMANPGRKDKTVPGFAGDLMMFADDTNDIRAWIRDGSTPGKAKSQTWQEERKRGTVRMPAFRRRLSSNQIDDLVAFVNASGGPEPEDSLATHGLERADSLGCVGCHGPGGRFARPNPRSLKGYVPSWDGADFPELVKDRTEFDEWVKDGESRRFAGNPLAHFFLRRAALHMPKYRDHLQPGDLDALWAYVEWLRAAPR